GRVVPIRALGVPLAYIRQASPDKILADLGLDGPGIAQSVQIALSQVIGAGMNDPDLVELTGQQPGAE
ncbi:MAG: hypothetical protein M0008_03175, partial [Actinomycetota bacterium]|nr:hypothetical protein [Actinomycetota bacterium]